MIISVIIIIVIIIVTIIIIIDDNNDVDDDDDLHDFESEVVEAQNPALKTASSVARSASNVMATCARSRGPTPRDRNPAIACSRYTTNGACARRDRDGAGAQHLHSAARLGPGRNWPGRQA